MYKASYRCKTLLLENKSQAGQFRADKEPGATEDLEQAGRDTLIRHFGGVNMGVCPDRSGFLGFFFLF